MPEQTNEELCALIQSGDDVASEQLLRQNKGYLYQMADQIMRRYDCSTVKDDLVQVGALALLRTAERFDPARGTKLLSYATIFLRAAMEREAKAHMKHQPATDVPTANAAAPDFTMPEEHFLRKAKHAHIRLLVRTELTLDEQEIITLLYGLGGEEELEVSEIARRMLLRPDSVRKAHKRALGKLRMAWMEQPEPWRTALASIGEAQRECIHAIDDCGPWELSYDVRCMYIE